MDHGCDGPAWWLALRAWGRPLTALYVLCLVLGTHLPDSNPAVETAVAWSGNDHLAHFLAYFGVTFLAAGLCGLGRGWIGATALIIALALFGAADELTQPYFDRSAEWLDWFGDVTGVLAGYAVTCMWCWYVACGCNRQTRRSPEWLAASVPSQPQPVDR